MDKDQIINNELLHTLARIFFEEYLGEQLTINAIKESNIVGVSENLRGVDHSGLEEKDRAIRTLNWIVDPIESGEKSSYRGYIIVPEMFFYLDLLKGDSKQKSIRELQKEEEGIYKFFRAKPKDGATIIREDEILYGSNLDTIHLAESVSEPIDRILVKYIGDIPDKGSRIRTAVAANEISRNLERSLKELKTPPDSISGLESAKYPTFYNGAIYCKRQSTEDHKLNIAETPPLYVFDTKTVQCAELSFQKFVDCGGLIHDKRYATKSHDLRNNFFFHKELLTDFDVVCLLKIHKYIENTGIKTTQSLVAPQELKINISDYRKKHPVLFQN